MYFFNIFDAGTFLILKTIGMKKCYIILMGIMISFASFAQVGIGTTNPDPGAILDLSSSTKGFLAPRVADHTLVTPVADGLLVYDTSTKSFWFYKSGTGWTEVNSLATGNYWSRDAGNAFTYLSNTTDKVSIGNFVSPPEKLNIDGNIWFSKNPAGTARKIAVQGQAGSGNNGSDLQIGAGGTMGLATAGNLFLDGGTHESSPGNVSIATIATGTVNIRQSTAPGSKINLAGSITTSTNVISSAATSYTLTDEDHTVFAEPASALTITIPSASGIKGRAYTIKLGGTGTIRVTAQPGEYIDGEDGIEMAEKWDYVTLVSNGTDWVSTSKSSSATDSEIWGRVVGTPNYTYLQNSTDALCIGTTNTTGTVNINGNIFFTRGITNSPKRITVEGQTNTSSDGCQLRISAGAGSPQSGGAPLYLDGGEDTFSDDDGDVLIQTVSNHGKVGIKTTAAPTSTLTINGSVGYRVIVKGNGNYSVLPDDKVIICVNDGIVYLPSAAAFPGREITVKRTYQNQITGTSLQATIGQTIDENNTYVLGLKWQFVTIVSDGANWLITSKN